MANETSKKFEFSVFKETIGCVAWVYIGSLPTIIPAIVHFEKEKKKAFHERTIYQKELGIWVSNQG